MKKGILGAMQTVVGVLRGGPSREHEVSLRTGAAVIANLPASRFVTRDIYIDRAGRWHNRGKALDPHRILRQLDVAFLAFHGEYGEDGEVQKLLERFSIPFTGAGSFASYVAMHKVLSKTRAQELGVRTPEFRYVERAEDAERLSADAVRSFSLPVIVKPVAWGSSVGVSVENGYVPTVDAVKKLFTDGAAGVLIEELVRGREATAGVVEGLRGEKLYALPPVEIIPPSGDFFSYGAKYSGETQEIVPGKFSRVDAEDLMHLAKMMHTELGLRHYSRSDFIVSPQGIYYLETNSLPGLTSESLLPKSLKAVGVPFSDFLSHLVDLARR